MGFVQSISAKVVFGRKFSAKVFRPKSLSAKFGVFAEKLLFSIRYKSIAVKIGSFAFFVKWQFPNRNGITSGKLAAKADFLIRYRLYLHIRVWVGFSQGRGQPAAEARVRV